MPDRQYTTPLILVDGETTRLARVSLTESGQSEAWLQGLLFEHPGLLPVEDIEPVFGPLYSVGREVRTSVGPLDLLYINPDGFITLAETKLWRNPQARREVVAQLIDYAKCIALWSYDDLRVALCRATGKPESEDPLLKVAAQADEAFDRVRFVDNVALNLRRGRFLLLIVGDGIQEGLEQMADFLSRTPQLGFTLALVEIALFRLAGKGERLLVQPRILGRTREVVRAIVEVRSGVSLQDVRVDLPEARQIPARRSITEDEYYARLGAAAGSGAIELVRAILGAAPGHGLEVIWSARGPALRYVHERTGYKFKLARFVHDGSFLAGGALDLACAEAGIQRAIANDYLDATRGLIPGSDVVTRGDKGMRHLDAASFVPLSQALDKWFSVVDRTVKSIDAALDSGEA